MSSLSALPPAQGKAIGDLFLMDWNFKMRIAGQLRRGWALLRPRISHSQSGDLLDHTCSEMLLGGQRGVMSRDILPKCLFSRIESILAKRCMCTHGRIKILPHVDPEPGKLKWLGTRNPEEMPHTSDLNYPKGKTVSESTHVSVR